jgi:ADP-ribose pyrophosphatase
VACGLEPDMNEPAIPRATRVVHTGRVFSVQIESITLPNGRPLEAEIVRHPGSVVVVPVADDGTLILVRQYRHAVGRYVWELPAGTLKPGEEPLAAAARECQEETGLIPGRLDYLGAFYPTPGYCDEIMNFYRATALRQPGSGDAEAHADEDEDIQTGTFARDQMLGMIASGEIVDLKTIGGLALLPRG